MSLYFLADIEIKDEKMYAEYIEKAPEIIKKYGGRYLVKGGKVATVSGNWNPKRIVVIEFPSEEALKECFNSEEYKVIAPLREKSTTSKAIIVEGCKK